MFSWRYENPSNEIIVSCCWSLPQVLMWLYYLLRYFLLLIHFYKILSHSCLRLLLHPFFLVFVLAVEAVILSHFCLPFVLSLLLRCLVSSVSSLRKMVARSGFSDARWAYYSCFCLHSLPLPFMLPFYFAWPVPFQLNLSLLRYGCSFLLLFMLGSFFLYTTPVI